jgi:hypothetical protein
MTLNKASLLLFFVLIFIVVFTKVQAQSNWPSEPWLEAENITATMDANGLTELSGLHWNPNKNRLYVSHGNGRLRVLQLNTTNNTFTQIANKSGLTGPEGITQVNYSTNEFYTIDENNYKIRRYTHTDNFSTITLANSWNLLIAPSPMTNTGNTGPEGITFIPDSFLSSIGFISQVTGNLYTSTKGMGGLIFVAHQDKGYIWVFDVNPNTNDDFAYVGKYKTNQTESCDLAFDRSTGMLYILHNTNGNRLEVTDLSTTTFTGGLRKFVVKKEYKLSNPAGNINIEGFAITPKCSGNVKAWLCRDVESTENASYKKDCIRTFNPFNADGLCPCAQTTSAISRSACNNYKSPSGKYTYTSSGTYKDTIQNNGGCDSVITLNVTITTLNKQVSKSGNKLTAQQTGATYQWTNCSNQFSFLPGETNNKFIATTEGNYAVIISKNACKDTSACYAIEFETLPYESENAIKSGAVNAYESDGYSGSGYVKFINNTGDYIEWKVDVSVSGIYRIEFIYANGSNSDRPLDLIVNSGTPPLTLSFPVTNTWSTWEKSNIDVYLNAGINTLRATSNGSNGPNIDYINVVSTNTITDVAKTDEAKDINIYPVPAMNMLNIKSIKTIDAIFVTDINGIEYNISFQHNKNNIQIDVSGFNEGLYLLTLQSGKKFYNRKFIIKR